MTTLVPYKSPRVFISAAQIQVKNISKLVTMYTGRLPYLRAKGVNMTHPKLKVAALTP
jgi:hypothetical protein